MSWIATFMVMTGGLLNPLDLLEFQLYRRGAAEDAYARTVLAMHPGMAARGTSPAVKVSLLDALYLFEFEFNGSSATEN